MTTHFITAEIDLSETDIDVPAQIDAKLKEQGEPLRWAVTNVQANTATVEAVVVQGEKAAPSS